MFISKIISGGQTGADRGGLEAAAALGLPHGGWCPKGRKAEDGIIPAAYALVETKSSDYPERTKRNIEESDLTIVFATGRPGRGSKLTMDIATRKGKPFLFVDLSTGENAQLSREITSWLEKYPAEGGIVLNIAGSRESGDPGIQSRVEGILITALEKFIE